ncbi:MAG: epoxyqueuosine reductase QueH [Actinomycetota bacterium]
MHSKPKILMHACCATCALHPCNLLKKDCDITLYYFNPNIDPRKEYRKRLEDIRLISSIYKIPLIIGRYQKARWLKSIAGLEEEPEGGRRCMACFKLRLLETARKAEKLGFDKFCTTLSVSPHKDVQAINRAGKQAGSYFDIDFMEQDFKKRDGFKKTIRMSKELDLYRQHYCGCTYSQK